MLFARAMERPDLTRARALLVTTAHSAGLVALSRVSQWLLFARAQLERHSAGIEARVPPRAQRFGKSLWLRITARFPALAELVAEPGSRSAPAAPPKQV